MAPPRKYTTEEEKITARKEAQKKYLLKECECKICDCIFQLKNKNRHLLSPKHIYHANKSVRPDTHNIKFVIEPNSLLSDSL